jgi:photosystem II stability/assembly factor-like uncharacterized protein
VCISGGISLITHCTTPITHAMKKLYIGIVVIFAHWAFPSGAQCQYTYHIVHSFKIDSNSYHFEAVDCIGNTCVASALKTDSSGNLSVVFFRSFDGGKSWNEQQTKFDSLPTYADYYLDRLQLIDSLHIACVGSSIDGNFNSRRIWLWSSDGGNSWVTDLDSALGPQLPSYSVHFSSPTTAIMTWDSSIYTTSDGGGHWNKAALHSIFLAAGRSYGGGKFAVFPWNSGKIYTTSDDWQHVDSSKSVPTTAHLYYYSFKGHDTIVGGSPFSNGVFYQLGLFRSIDAGASWEPIALSDSITPDMDFRISNLQSDPVCVGGLGQGGNRRIIVVSHDHGMSWSFDSVVAGDALYPYPQFEIAAAAGTTNGEVVAIIEISPTSGAPTYLARLTPHTMRVSSLLQNPALDVYPNPTTDRINVSAQSPFSAIVIDALGRSYSVQNHDGTLDVSLLPAGVYYVSDGKWRAKFVKE